MDWLLGELAAFDAFFAAGRSLMPDHETAQWRLLQMITGGPFFLAEHPSEGRVGFIVGMLTPHYFNPALRVLTELLWWVPVAQRGTRAGAQLLAHFLDYGRAHADWIIMSLEAESPIDPAGLVKRGFRAKETSYLLEVTT